MSENDERQMNLERIKNYASALYIAVVERYKILPLISTISATLVGLLIQSNMLIKTRYLSFISLIILLLLIPISMFTLLYQLDQDRRALTDRITNILNPEPNNNIKDGAAGWFLYFLFGMFSLAIILIVLSFFA